MKVIDRYILREFLRNFFFSLIFFTVLLLIVRFSEKDLGRFVSSKMSISASILSMIYQIPEYIIQVAPPSVLFAAFFSLGRMTEKNEITALKAAGVSLYRVFLPLFIASVIVSLLMIVFTDQIATRAHQRDASLNETYSNMSRIGRHMVFEGSEGQVFYIDILFLTGRRMQNLSIYEFDKSNKVRRETFASSATWDGKTWHLKKGTVRTFSEEGWSEETYDEKDIVVKEDPEIMVKSKRDLKEMSFADISKLIQYKKTSGKAVRRDIVSLHHKIAFPVACFIMALLGAPLFVMFGKSGTAVGFLLTMLVSFLYWGIAIAVFEAFGANGKLPPVLSCWAANLVFGAVGLVFVYKVKK